MSLAVVAPDRLAVISLIGDGRSPLLPLLRHSRAFRGATHIPVEVRTTAERNRFAASIDAAVAGADRAVMLVAQGSGCLAAAWWARLSPRFYVSRIAGAVMIAPDEAASGGSFASPRTMLPFPSIIVGGDGATARLAGEWGSRVIDASLSIEAPARAGRFQTMIERFTAAVVERDVAAAERLIDAFGDW